MNPIARKIYYQTTIEVVKGKLQCRNYFVTIEREIPGGHQIRLSTGSIVNVMQTGKVILQGKNDINIKEILGFLRD